MASGSDYIDDIMSRTGTGTDPSADAIQNGVDINTVNVYDFMDHAESGGDGFRDGTYLVPHDREMFYNSRRRLAFYKNFVKPILRAMVDRALSEQAPRRVEEDNASGNALDGLYFNGFLEDCDGGGGHIQSFTRQVVEKARLHGVTFVVMENFPQDAQPPTKMEAAQMRAYPYVYMQAAQTVDDYKTDRFGNLLRIAFREPDAIVTNASGDKDREKRVRVWDTMAVRVMKVTSSEGAKRYEPVEGEEPVEHGLGVVPVYACIAGRKKSPRNLLVDPPLYDLARINHAIYNKSSEMREIERAQEFAVFYMQTADPGNVTIGTHNFLALPMETNIAPGYASPDSATMSELRENETALREDLFRIAEQQGVTGITDQSGVSKQWDFAAQESVLKTTSAVATAFEAWCAAMFKRWTGEQFFYMVEYPFDFAPADKSGEVETLDKLSMMGFPPKATALIKEKAFRAQMADQDQSAVDEAVQEIREEAENATTVNKPPSEEEVDE